MDTKLKIGYRISINNFEYNYIEKFITQYNELFEIFELKITEEILFSNKFKKIVDISKKLSLGCFSLHLPKNILEYEFERISKLLNSLDTIKFNKKTMLITHISKHFEINYIFNKLSFLSSELPKNTILLLENSKTESLDTEYLKNIDILFLKLNKSKINNIGFCLDIGHLCYDFYKCGINNELAFQKIEKTTHLLNMIKEIHLHDFTTQKDHVYLGNGNLNIIHFKNFLNKNNIYCPIILENTISNLRDDGLKQVKYLKSNL